jgi:hypothetical protein
VIDTAHLYFDISLKTDPDFADQDMSIFEVEPTTVEFRDESDSWSVFLKGGTYEVEENETMLIVRIPVE